MPFPQWKSSRAREGNSWTHALIMLYFRWYPVVSHFNNPPQLDVLVPSARHCLVIGPGWSPVEALPPTLWWRAQWGTHTVVLLFPHPSLVFFSFSEPDGAPWVLRLLRAGVRAGHGREGSHLDLLACKEDLRGNIKALLYLAAASRRSLLASWN